MDTKYIIGGVVVVLLVIVVYFLFFRKGDEKKDVKKKKNNLYIAMKATGAIVEEYEEQYIFTEKSCEIIADMIFGKDADGGLNVIYEDVMGKKFPQERFKCKGRSEDDVKSDTQKIANQHIVDMYAAILKNKDVKKRNNDLIAIWVLLFNGIAKAMAPDKFLLRLERDGDDIKTIEFILKLNKDLTIVYTPEMLIEKTNISAEANASSIPKERNLTTQLATPLVNSQEIERLKKDTNPKMTVDTLASLIIYELSKTGFSSPLN